MREYARQETWQNYMAAIGYSIGNLVSSLGGNEYPMPTYYDLTNGKPEPEDERSGIEIVNSLIDRLN